MSDEKQRVFGGYAEEPGLKPARDDKHLRLDSAISAQQEVIGRISRLICRAHPRPQEAAGISGADRNPVSLVELLEEGPDRIRKNTDIMLNQLDELESLLF